MRLPVRKSQMLKKRDDEAVVYLTEGNIAWLKDEIVRLEKVERPKIVEDLSHALSLGDFSENAEYQDAKARMARIDGRIFSLKERLKRAEVIPAGGSDRVRLGSRVTVEMEGKLKTYHIVGPQESSPVHGRISHVSPLGAALLGHGAGEIVTLKTERGESVYMIVEVT